MDEGDRGVQLIEGNGVTLVRVPEGPGWSKGGRHPEDNLSWNEIARYGKNAGCTWNGEAGRANCEISPDKDWPLMAPDWSPIYYCTADEFNETEAYYVSFNGWGIRLTPHSGLYNVSDSHTVERPRK